MSSSDARTVPPRRVALRGLGAAATTLLLASCGFHLRGAATYEFTSIYVQSRATPAFRAELVRALDAGGNAKVTETAQGAQVVLEIVSLTEDKDVLSLSSTGSVQEYLLTTRVSFHLRDANGLDWLPPGEIVLRRSYQFNQTEVLARDIEEQRLLREMRSDAIAQLIRRLQAASKPA